MRSQGMRLQRTRGSRNEEHWLRPKFLNPSALLVKKGLPLSLVAARFVATRDWRWHRRAALWLRRERRGIRDRRWHRRAALWLRRERRGIRDRASFLFLDRLEFRPLLFCFDFDSAIKHHEPS